MAAILIGLLGFPSVAGTKTLTGLIAIMVKEAQKQLADSMPPPPVASVSPVNIEDANMVIVHTDALPPQDLFPPKKNDSGEGPGL